MRNHMVQHKTTRRQFLKHSTTLAAAWCVAGHETTSQARSPIQKLNIGVIGCGGRGFADLQGCATENIVALCDVDEARAAQALAAYPKAKRYLDYRQMLEKQRDLDGVIVAVRVGKRIEWDAEYMKARRAPEVEAFVKRECRRGWTL